jgi:type IV pilus assembly protein PilA
MVQKKLFGLIILLATVAPSLADAQPAPQTARQALIEMFFSKTPGTFEKHLPDAMVTTLKKANSGASLSALNSFGLLAGQIHGSGQEFQTYEAGPILLSMDNQREHSKLEIIVERDDLQGEQDEIEVSCRAYKDGQIQLSGMSPRFTFGLKQEAGVWRLDELTFSFKVSLTDPELLKMITTWQSAASNASLHPSLSTQASPHSFDEASVVIAMRNIVRAEQTYASTYGHGYTCSLSDLGGIGGDEANDHHARLIDPRLASGNKYGYRFAVAGCGGTAASKLVLTAVPAEGIGQSFCTDESAAIQSSSDGTGASCMSSGKPLQ